MESDNFIELKLSRDNLAVYIIRQSIYKAIKRNMNRFQGILLDVGCGKMPYKKFILKNSNVRKYVGMDIENALIYDTALKPDTIWDGKKIPFSDDSFDVVLATEVLEHCPDPNIVVKEIHRVLKTDGIFFFSVPFFWPLHETPHDQFRYTPFALERILKKTNFKSIKINAGGGWHASLAQMIGLWTKRAPLHAWQRNFFSFLTKPIINFLIKKDKKNRLIYAEQQMFTNFYGTAEK